MQGDVWRDGSNESGDSIHICVAVVHAWHNKRGDLEMASGIVERSNRPADGMEIPARPIVEILRRPLEIDVCGIYQRRDLIDDGALGASVRDEDIGKPPCANFPCAIPDELPADERFVVGIGESDVAVGIAQPQRHVRQFGRDYTDYIAKAGFTPFADDIYYTLGDKAQTMRLARPGEELIYGGRKKS